MSLKISNGIVFHPSIAFLSAIVTAIIAGLTDLATQNPQYALIVGILVAAITSGFQAYQQQTTVSTQPEQPTKS